MSVVGFDFGNSDCYIAQAKRGGIDLILNENSNRKNPCLVSFQGKERFVGEAAVSMARSNYKNTLKCVKRLIGRKFKAPEVQAELAALPFKACELEDGSVGFQVMYDDEERTFACQKIFAIMLGKLKGIVEAANPGVIASDIVCSVPGWFDDAQRAAILDAVKISGLNCLRLMNEHTATALAYGIYKSARNLFHESEPQYVMFVDMGHSGYCVSVVAFVQGKLNVKGVGYDRNLGGRDFDKVAADYFADDFKTKTKNDVTTNAKAMLKLLAASEKSKKNMSPMGVKETNCSVECLMNDADYNGKLSLEDFEAAAAPLVARLGPPVEKALADAGVTKEQLSFIEIVGGGTRVQCVKKELARLLGTDTSKVNCGLSTTLNADESVSRGCALQCAILSPLFKVKEFAITDLVPYSIRLSWEQTTTDAMDVGEGGEGDEGDASGDGENSIVIMKELDETPKTRRVTFRRSESFEVVAAYEDGSFGKLPEGTEQHLGKYKITIPPIEEGDEELPRIRVNVRHNIHGVFGVSSAHLMREIKEEPKAEKAPEAKPEASAEAAPAPPADGAEAKPEAAGGAGADGAAEGGAAPAAEEGGAGAGEAPKEEKKGDGGGDDAGAAPPADAGAAAEEGDKKADAPAADAAPAGEAKPEEPAAPKKKRYKKIELMVDSFTSQYTKAQMDDAIEEEAKMAQQDRIIRETNDKRNELETYIYDMRSKVSGELSEFIPEDHKTAFDTDLNNAEEWLYSDEGFDSTKAVYTQKLADLQAKGNKPLTRQRETNQRPQATSELLQMIEKYKGVAESKDPMYEHLTGEEKGQLRLESENAEKWLYEQLNVQNEMNKNLDPVLTVAMINERKQTVINVCRPIETKPKPIPKKEEKKEEDKPAADASTEGKEGEGDAAAEGGAGADGKESAPDAAPAEEKAGEGKEGEQAGADAPAADKMDLD